MPRLPVYLVPTPIGSSLADMALGSFKVLEGVPDLFVESESRVLKKLIKRGTITPQHRLHRIDEGSPEQAEQLLDRGLPFAILADTGMPCFLDPGHRIVRRLLDRHLDRIKLVPLGMSSALDAALACCGLDFGAFAFLGHHPEHVDYAVKDGHRHPLVLYLHGGSARSWLDEVDSLVPLWKRLSLFRNLRDRSEERVAILRKGDPAPDWVVDKPGDDYVVVIER